MRVVFVGTKVRAECSACKSVDSTAHSVILRQIQNIYLQVTPVKQTKSKNRATFVSKTPAHGF